MLQTTMHNTTHDCVTYLQTNVVPNSWLIYTHSSWNIHFWHGTVSSSQFPKILRWFLKTLLLLLPIHEPIIKNHFLQKWEVTWHIQSQGKCKLSFAKSTHRQSHVSKLSQEKVQNINSPARGFEHAINVIANKQVVTNKHCGTSAQICTSILKTCFVFSRKSFLFLLISGSPAFLLPDKLANIIV